MIISHTSSNNLDTRTAYRFRPKTYQLYVRDGDKSDGNVGCDPQEPLKPLVKSSVTIQMRDKRVAVYVNGEQVCTAAREDRLVMNNAIVYSADPYVAPLSLSVRRARWFLLISQVLCN